MLWNFNNIQFVPSIMGLNGDTCPRSLVRLTHPLFQERSKHQGLVYLLLGNTVFYWDLLGPATWAFNF